MIRATGTVRAFKDKVTKNGKEYRLVIFEQEFGEGVHYIWDWNKHVTNYPCKYVLTWNDSGGFKTLVDFRFPEEKEHPIEVLVKEDKDVQRDETTCPPKNTD